MKEILTKVIIAVVVIAVIGVGATFLLKSDEPDVPGQTTASTFAGDVQNTSQQGSNEVVNGTTAAQTPSGGTQGTDSTQSQQGIQPSQGTDPTQSQQGVQPSQGTDPTQSQQGVQPSQGTDPTQSQQGVQPSQGTDPTQSQQGVQPSQGTDPTQSQQGVQPSQSTDPTQSQQSTQPSQTYKVDYYQNIFRSGRFLMKVNDPDLGEVVMAMNGNKMFVEASMEGMTLKMLYDGDKPDEKNPQSGTWYIVIDKIKKYSPMPADMLGGMNIEELTKDFAKSDGDSVYTTGYETVNGEQLYCESCTDTNGNTTKYYFRGDQLIRSDSVSPSGEVSSTEFKEINPNVDDSLFVIPSGYAKWDISWLLNMAASE